MSDETTSAPEGVSETVTATQMQPMTAEAAAGLLAGWDDDAPEVSEPADTPSDDEATETPEPEPEGEDGEAEASAEAEEAPEPPEGEEETPEEPGIDWDKVPGEAKFRLRDGRVVTAADLKRDFDELQTARQLRETYEKNLSQFEQQRAQAAQQYQQFLPIAQQAITAIQASLPQVPNPPDPSLASSDPIRYVEERARYDAVVNDYNAKVGQMRQIQAQAEQQRQRAEAEKRQHLDGYINEQRTKLLDAMPDLRDTAKRQEFYREFVDHGTNVYGFTADELNNVYDARLMRMAADAMAYRKLMAKGAPKPGTQPAKGKPAASQPQRPAVASGGKRETPAESQATRREKLWADARKKGPMDARTAARLLAQLES